MNESAISIINLVAVLAVSVLSGLGVGSGGLLVAYLISTSQATAPEARTANLLFFIVSAGAAFILNLRSRKLIPELIFKLSAFGILGCLLGAWVSGAVSHDTTKKIFGIMLVISGTYALIGDLAPKKLFSSISAFFKKDASNK